MLSFIAGTAAAADDKLNISEFGRQLSELTPTVASANTPQTQTELHPVELPENAETGQSFRFTLADGRMFHAKVPDLSQVPGWPETVDADSRAESAAATARCVALACAIPPN